MDGYFNPEAGWVDSRRVLLLLKEAAERAGVRIYEHYRIEDLIWDNIARRVTGVVVALNPPQQLPFQHSVLSQSLQASTACQRIFSEFVVVTTGYYLVFLYLLSLSFLY